MNAFMLTLRDKNHSPVRFSFTLIHTTKEEVFRVNMNDFYPHTKGKILTLTFFFIFTLIHASEGEVFRVKMDTLIHATKGEDFRVNIDTATLTLREKYSPLLFFFIFTLIHATEGEVFRVKMDTLIHATEGQVLRVNIDTFPFTLKEKTIHLYFLASL